MQFSKNHPRQNLKETFENGVWFAPPAMLVGEAASNIVLELGSSFVQDLQPR